MLRGLIRRWRGQRLEHVRAIVRDHPERLAIAILQFVMADSYGAREPPMLAMRHRIDHLSARQARQLGESLVRGEGLASLRLTAEEAALFNTHFGSIIPTAELIEHVRETLARAVGL